MRFALGVATCGMLVGCKPSVESSPSDGLRFLQLQNVAFSKAVKRGEALSVSWEVSVHSCDPIENLIVSSRNNVVDIRVHAPTRPADQTCTTNPNRWEQMGVTIPPNLLRDRVVTVRLNGEDVGQVEIQ